MDLLPLRHVGIVLGDSLQGQLLHQVDLIRLLQVRVLTHTTQVNVAINKLMFRLSESHGSLAIGSMARSQTNKGPHVLQLKGKGLQMGI